MRGNFWGEIPDHSLTIVDRGFQASNVLHPLHQGGANRHFLVRARSDTTGKVVTRTTPTDELVEFTICPSTRRKEPTLLTSLLDPKKYPAHEIIALYHERWEIEMGFDELKTDMLERNVPMRSQTPQGVRQEL